MLVEPANEGVIRRAVAHVKNHAIAQASGCVTHRMTAASNAQSMVCAIPINEIDVPMVVSALKKSHWLARLLILNSVVTPAAQPTMATVMMADQAQTLMFASLVPIAATAARGLVMALADQIPRSMLRCSS